MVEELSLSFQLAGRWNPDEERGRRPRGLRCSLPCTVRTIGVKLGHFGVEVRVPLYTASTSLYKAFAPSCRASVPSCRAITPFYKASTFFL